MLYVDADNIRKMTRKKPTLLALNNCSSSQGIAIGVGDDLPSFSVSNLSVNLSGNVLIIPSG